MRQTDFLEPIPRDREMPTEVRAALRRRLMQDIRQDQAHRPRSRLESGGRRRITIVAAVLLSLLSVGAAWAALTRQPEQTTNILCPENDVIPAVSGDPVADCAAALRDLGIEPPEMVAYANEAGGVIVVEADGEVSEGLQPLGDDFRQDTAIIELEAALHDVTTGLEADCYTTEEAIPIVERAVDRVGLDWSVDVITPADGESTCAYGFSQPEISTVGLSKIEAPMPSDEEQPWEILGRRLNEALATECLELQEAATVAERLAEELAMEEMVDLTQTVDDGAQCTRATVTVGGVVFIDLRGPDGQ